MFIFRFMNWNNFTNFQYSRLIKPSNSQTKNMLPMQHNLHNPQCFFNILLLILSAPHGIYLYKNQFIDYIGIFALQVFLNIVDIFSLIYTNFTKKCLLRMLFELACQYSKSYQ